MRFSLRVGVCLCAAAVLGVVASQAQLLQLRIDTPVVVYDSQGSLTYDPGNGFFSALIERQPDPTPLPTSPELGLEALPLIVLLDTGLAFVQAPKSFDVLIEVDSLGQLTGGVLGDDLILEGVVDLDNDGTADLSGVLLTGEILGFGFEDTGTSTDRFDMLFRITGGAMAGLMGSDFMGVTVTSENSTFTGSFAVSFSGGAKGNIGATHICEINVDAISHTVGSGSHPSSTREPLVGLVISVYDKSEGSCARQQDVTGDGISHNEYPAIVTNCVPVATRITDANGEVTFFIEPGDYLVIGDDGTDKLLGISASDCFDGVVMNKHLQQIIKSDGKKSPAKKKKHVEPDGAELIIIEPEYVIWDGTEQLYPFIFESVDEFGVTTSVAPPEGFIADYDSLSTDVIAGTDSLQFTITEVGSDLVPTGTTFELKYKGRSTTMRSDVGIVLTEDYARSRGFNVKTLRSKGLIFDPSGRADQARNERAQGGK